MQSVLRQFVVNRDDGAEPGQLLDLPGSAFTVSEPARSASLRRLWLDTFDWRLYRSGLTLEQISSRGATDLVLTGRDGAILAADHAGDGPPKWPGGLDVLPHGPLRDRLGPVTGVRALLPVARAVSSVRDNRVLNSDDKTIARITVDRMSVTYPAAGTVPPRVAVTALRGYQPQALRLVERWPGCPGSRTAAGPGSRWRWRRWAARPGDYSGKIDVRLTPRMPASVAIAAVLTALLDTLEANVDGVLRDIDTEFLHDLRVAVRRTRSAIKLLGDALRPDGWPGGSRPSSSGWAT